ncbi:hypothetical protein [Gorillibacterium sp. sgz5001074]|uniref:hypothetical protein n=1 Tax=Gorillibacterium sp. sgz5001074 TaxID=3446695 RepID=UPI003F679338
MPTADKKSFDRDITYQVGWKKGKIHIQGQTGAEPGKPAAEEGGSGALSGELRMEDQEPGRIWTSIWRALPYPTENAVFVLAAVLPVAAFAAVLWLVSKLSQAY